MERKKCRNYGKILYGALLTVLIFSINSKAAVTIDNTSSNGASDTITGITTLTWSHTVNSCSHCVLYVGVSSYTQANIPTARVQSVTYGMQTLTAVGNQVSPFPNLPQTGNSAAELYRLIAPAAGTATITVTFLVPVNYAVGGANSLNGVSQTTPNSAFFSASGNSAAPAVNASNAVVGDLALDVLATTPNAVFVAPDATQTVSYNGRNFFGFAFDIGAGSTEAPMSAVTPMTWMMTSSSVWALGAVTVKQFVSTASLASVSGQVRQKNGREIANLRVVLQDLETGEQFYTTTDARGRYLFDQLEISRLYAVRVYDSNYRFPQPEQTVYLFSAVENLDFVGVPRKRIGN